jgi:hypothetical protein
MSFHSGAAAQCGFAAASFSVLGVSCAGSASVATMYLNNDDVSDDDFVKDKWGDNHNDDVMTK